MDIFELSIVVATIVFHVIIPAQPRASNVHERLVKRQVVLYGPIATAVGEDGPGVDRLEAFRVGGVEIHLRTVDNIALDHAPLSDRECIIFIEESGTFVRYY